MLGDPNDSAPAVLPAPHFFAARKASEDGLQCGVPPERELTEQPANLEADDSRGDRWVPALNAVLLVGALMVGATFIVRLIATFGDVVNPFR